MKGKSKTVSLKWEIFLSFIAFLLIALSLIWLFETVFFNSFYEHTKTRMLKRAAVNIEENIKSENLYELTDKISRDGRICVLVINQYGAIVCNHDAYPECVLHHISTFDIVTLRDKALENEGEYYTKIKLEQNGYGYRKNDFSGKVPKSDSRSENNLIYVKTAETDGIGYVIMLNSLAYPHADTENAVTLILIIVSILLTGVSLTLALILSRTVSKPISRLNSEVKLLATGNYDTVFDADGYREISELSSNMQLASNELAKVDDYRSKLIANLSHDLRTPLTLISAYAEMMQDMPEEATKENLQIIVDESKHLNDLVNDVLDMSKYNSGEISLNLECFDLSELIKETMERYNKLREQEGYTIEAELQPGSFIKADRVKISQVLYNLINNAISYTGGNKNIRVIMRKSETTVRVDVVDNGEGIPEDKLPLIWNRYYKIDNEHTRTNIGSGLGLSIVKAILEKHGAVYGANSILKVGTDIWFELPICVTDTNI